MPTSITNAELRARSIEILANSAVAGDQVTPTISRLSDGNFVVVWADAGTLQIKAQILSASGQTVGRELSISSVGGATNSEPVVTGLDGGGFVVAWNRTSGTQVQTVNGVDIPFPAEAEVYARQFDNSGIAAGVETRVNVDTTGLQMAPGITSLTGGGYFISFLSLNGYDPFGTIDGSLTGTIYNSAGASPSGPFLVNNLSYGLGMQSQSAGFADGRFVVVWDGIDLAGQDRSGTGISMQLFNADGTKIGGAVTVNQTSTNVQISPRVTVLEDGNFVVVWNDWLSSQNASQKFDIRGQVFTYDGARLGNEFAVAADLGVQQDPSIVALGQSGFMVTWTDESGLVGSVALGPRDPSASVKAQYFELDYQYDDLGMIVDGNPVRSGVFQINQLISGTQNDVAVERLDDKTLAFTWTDASGQNGDPSGTSIRTNVISLNLAPEVTFNSLPGIQLDAAGFVSVNLAQDRVFDPEGDALSFRLLEAGTNRDVTLPSWLQFDAVTGELSGTYQGEAVPNALSVDLEIRDSNGAASRISDTIMFERAGLSQIGETQARISYGGLPERYDLPNGEFTLVYSGADRADGADWRRSFAIEEFNADGLQTNTRFFTAKTPYTDLQLTPVSPNGGTFQTDGYVLTAVDFRSGRDRVVVHNVPDENTGFLNLAAGNFTETPGLNGLAEYSVSSLAGGGYQIFSNHQPVSTLAPNTPPTETVLYRREPFGTNSIIDYFNTQGDRGGATVQGMSGQLATVSDGAGKTLHLFERYSASQYSGNRYLGYSVYDDTTDTHISGAFGRPLAIGQYYAPIHDFRVFNTDLGYFVVSIHESAYSSNVDYRVDKATGGIGRMNAPVNDLFYLANGYSVSARIQNGLSLRVYDEAFNIVVDDYDFRNSTTEATHLATALLPGEGPEIIDLGGGRFRVSGIDQNGNAVFEDFSIDALQNNQTLSGNADTWTSAGTNSAFVRGLGGNDSLTGSAFADTLLGGDGDDTLTGRGGMDRLLAGSGNDVLQVGPIDAAIDDRTKGFQNDFIQIIGGPGVDTLVLGAEGYLDFQPGGIREIEVIDFSQSGRASTQIRISGEDASALLRQPGGLTLRGSADPNMAGGLEINITAPFISGGAELDLSNLQLVNWDGYGINIYSTAPLRHMNITGSDGRDFVIGSNGDDFLDLGGGKDRAMGAGGDDIMFGDGYQARFAQGVPDQVFRLYQATLGRDPDVAGYTGWTQRIDGGGVDLRDVAAGFVASQEFQQVYGVLSDTNFVELLYQNVLNRPSDTAGQQGWLNRLTRGETREQVVLGFSESQEFIVGNQAAASSFNAKSDPVSWSGSVYRLYQATLNRDPDSGGFEGWSERLADGASLQSISANFVGSPEFQAAYGTLSNAAFVDLLYQNVLGRPADAAGAAQWIGQLNQGVSRSQVVLGFSESQEFITNTTPGIAAWSRGLGEHDRLEPGAGSNIVAGGMFSDTFVFDAGQDGDTRVLDLEPWDTVLFNNFGYTNDAAVSTHLQQTGNDLLFSDQGVSILFENTTIAELTSDIISIA